MNNWQQDWPIVVSLVCPENLSPLRSAEPALSRELAQRLKDGSLPRWCGGPVRDPRRDEVDGFLLRADGRVAYPVVRGRPMLSLSEALLIDDSLGDPQPKVWRETR